MARRRTKSAAPRAPEPAPSASAQGAARASEAVAQSLPVKPEFWVLLAWVVVALEAALAMYLGAKQTGVAPIRAYLIGPPLLAALALAVGVFGAVWSYRRRPFASPQRIVAFCLLGFVFATTSYHVPFPSHRSFRPSRVKVHAPFEGEWTVAWGGPDDSSPLLATRPDRRFARLFVVVREGATRADRSDPRSAFAFGEPVFAPCDGRVVRAVSEFSDDGGTADDLGNHVVLEIAPEEFLFVSGLARDSLEVKVGDDVVLGQRLGRVGFSSASRILPEPHLGLHVQDTPEPIWGQAIPYYLHDVVLNGAPAQRAEASGRGFFPGFPPAGDRVRPAP